MAVNSCAGCGWRALPSRTGWGMTRDLKQLLLSSAVLSLLSATPTWAAETADQAELAARTTVEEVVVTAEKKEESSRLVPASVTAISGETLARAGITSYADLGARAPGFYVTSSTPGIGSLRLRGLSASAGGPLVAIMVNGVNFGSSTAFARSGLYALDLNPFDVERVEILRGPQGTLYGSNSIGGILSYVTKAPDLHEFQAVGSVEVSQTAHGGLNNAVRGAVNLPLNAGKVAVRLSAYRDTQEGFLDNPRRGEKDVNGGYVEGARGELLVQPGIENLTVRLGGLYQKVDRDSTNELVYSRSPLTQLGGELDQPMRVPAYVVSEFKQGYLVVDWSSELVDVVSTTSYAKSGVTQQLDYTGGGLVGTLDLLGKGAFGPGVPLGPAFPQPAAASLTYEPSTTKFVQELLLRSTSEGKFKWMVGGYHTQEYSNQTQTVTGLTPTYLPAAGLERALLFTLASEYTEYAAFANGTLSITPKLDVTGGVRYSHVTQTYRQLGEGSALGPLNALLARGGGGLPIDTRDSHSKHNQATYLFNARYRVTEGSMLYARAASGYRPGGPNIVGTGLAPNFQPDSAWSYEAGAKVGFWEGRGLLDVAAFYVDWKDFQTIKSVGGVTGYINAHGATSQGVEATLTVVPTMGLNITATAAYIEAVLTDDEPSIGARKGESLPDTPKWGGAVISEYSWLMPNDWLATVSGTARYVGREKTAYGGTVALPAIVLAPYTLVDLSAALERGRYRIAAFVRNATDERAKLSSTTLFGTPFIGVQRPRTIGVTLTAKY